MSNEVSVFSIEVSRGPQIDLKSVVLKRSWKDLSFGKTLDLAERFVNNFKEFMAENGVKSKEHTDWNS